MPTTSGSGANFPLEKIEPRLRPLLPADLYAQAWMEPSAATLVRVFEHLRTLHRILQDYMPRPVAEAPPRLGHPRHEWHEGTLMFTDLVGFTPLLEAYFAHGDEGAQALLEVLNSYFAEMIEIIGKSGGSLVEFAGDAMLAQFVTDRRHSDTLRAVRAALRMQRAMQHFAYIPTEHGPLSLGMRIGIHSGRFLAADSGTPRRMDHWLLGQAVLLAKQSESQGQMGRVCLSPAAHERVEDQFRCEPAADGHQLVTDDIAAGGLGEFDIGPTRRVLSSPLLLKKRTVEALVDEIEEAVKLVEPLAGYVPREVLTVLIENAADRRIAPDFPRPTVMFINVAGLTEAVDHVQPHDTSDLLLGYSRLFARINAAVEARGGVLTSTTYHPTGSGLLACFGVPNARFNDPLRAAATALAIREVIEEFSPPRSLRRFATVTCQIGIARGPVFAAEIGGARGRREFNILGDTVNTAARLMHAAGPEQILLSEAVHSAIADRFECQALGEVTLKGKSAPVPVYALRSRIAPAG